MYRSKRAGAPSGQNTPQRLSGQGDWPPLRLGALKGHLAGQTDERALRGLARSVSAGLPQQLRELLVRVPHLHAADDRLALVGGERRQGTLVTPDRLLADGDFERRLPFELAIFDRGDDLAEDFGFESLIGKKVDPGSSPG